MLLGQTNELLSCDVVLIVTWNLWNILFPTLCLI